MSLLRLYTFLQLRLADKYFEPPCSNSFTSRALQSRTYAFFIMRDSSDVSCTPQEKMVGRALPTHPASWQ
jgi:hypothetical protein